MLFCNFSADLIRMANKKVLHYGEFKCYENNLQMYTNLCPFKPKGLLSVNLGQIICMK